MSNQLAKQDVPMSGGLVQFQSASDALYFAEAVFKSGLAPAGFKSPQAIFVAVQQGAELGMKPMQSLQGIAVINGRTSLYDKTARGLAMASGQVESMEDRFEGSGDDLTAITTIKRKGVSSPFIGKFSVGDAKRAGLWGKAGPWTLYPKDMQTHKSSSRALNAGFADVLIGLPVFEDIQDLPPERKPSENPNPVEDPLLKQVPSIRQMMEEKSNNPTRDGASIIGGENERSGTMVNALHVEGQGPQESPSEPFEIHPDDLDYQASVSESQPVGPPAGASSVTGASIVEGPIENAYAPKSDKAPWNIVIGGIKMAVWRRSLPVIVDWLEKRAKDPKQPICGKTRFHADYTTEVDPKYTNHTCVSLQSIKGE